MMDEALERAIDEAGRGVVFDRAAALGWTPANPPPKWVWAQLAAEVRAGMLPSVPPRRLDEAVFGFRLLP